MCSCPPVSIDAKCAFLKRPCAYPEKPRQVEAVETHMSWVFLTDTVAYKLKKPARFEFLDFSTIEARRRNCEEEVRLNRRLAANVYLGVVPLSSLSDGTLLLGGDGRIEDWLVKMRRLPGQRMLDRLIANHDIRAPEISELGRMLGSFYLRASPIGIAPAAYRQQVARELDEAVGVLRQARYALHPAQIDRIHSRQADFLRREYPLLEQRADEHHIVEGHGDLRPEHVCLERKPVIIDCLEFNVRFRTIDPADELGFLAMECERLGAEFVGPILFDEYGKLTGDRPPSRLVDFYKSSRACLRAKLAAWHIEDPSVRDHARWADVARAYLNVAERYAGRLS